MDAKNWYDSLNHNEYRALREYQGNAHEEINDALRTGDQWLLESHDTTIFWMDEALKRGALESNQTLYRGLCAGKVVKRFDALVGQRMTWKGFTSTSRREATVRNWFTGQDGVVVVLSVPDGTPAAEMDMIAPDLLTMGPEEEILLARGLTVEFTAIEIRNGVRYAYAEIK